jgi:hypothetical protein
MAHIYYFEPENADRSQGLFLITTDLVGLAASVLNHYRRVFSSRLSVPFERIIICSNHTHSSFESIGLLGQGIPGMLKSRLDTQVLNGIMAKILVGMRNAIQNCEIVFMGFTKIKSPEPIGIIRRKPFRIADVAIGIVKFGTPDHRLKAVFVNIGTHCTFLTHRNTLLSADWSGALVRFLNSQLTQVSCAHFLGAQGDVAPELPASERITMQNQPKYDNFAIIQLYASYIGKLVIDTLPSIIVKPFNAIQNVMEDVLVPRKSFPTNNTWSEIWRYIRDQFMKSFLFHLFTTLNPKIFAFENLKGKYNHTYAHVLKLGDLFVILSPGELFFEYGEKLMRFRDEKSYPNSMIFAIANDYASYLYPVAEYVKGGYENEFQICPLNGPRIVGRTLRILRNLSNQLN